MKKIIKGLYIAFFPEQYEAERDRVIKELQREKRHVEDVLLVVTGMADEKLSISMSRELAFQSANYIKQIRESEEKMNKILAGATRSFQLSNLDKQKSW